MTDAPKFRAVWQEDNEAEETYGQFTSDLETAIGEAMVKRSLGMAAFVEDEKHNMCWPTDYRR